MLDKIDPMGDYIIMYNFTELSTFEMLSYLIDRIHCQKYIRLYLRRLT